jgi:hypothetical protein
MTETKTNQSEELTVDNSVVSFDEPVINDDIETDNKFIEEPKVNQEEDNKDKRIDQNVILETPVFSKTEWKENDETLDLPSTSDKESIGAINLAPNVSLVDSEESRKWANILAAGLQMTSFNNAFVETIEDQTAEFHQGVAFNGAALAGAHPRFKAIEDENIKGERGILRFMSHLGLGTIFQAPLWHTGIWITFKAPSEGELLELQRQLIADKISFGRMSYGMVFSNTSSYITDRLISFAFNHIYDTTLKSDDSQKIDLKTIVSSHDIPAVVWGLLCSIYPRGFQYRRACATDPEKCNHIVEERLNLSKILWTNTRALTPWQVTHMSDRKANSKTLESVKRYKEELLKCQKRKVEINKDSGKSMNLTLKIPTIAEYVEAGHRWIGEIVSMVNKALGIEANDNDRNDYIMKQGQATAMRQYMHWVDNIEFASNKIEDKTTLEGILDILSADDNVRNEFMEEISKYINNTSIAVIGIPVYDCPKCGSTQDSPLVLPAHTNIIPLDVYQTFFGLIVQKLEKIASR